MERKMPLESPVRFYDRTGHHLKPGNDPLKSDLKYFLDFTMKNEFCMNSKKSTIMFLNFCRSIDFNPRYEIWHVSNWS